MDADEAQARMREIQRIMETATLYTILPGTAAIVGGLLALAGCGASCWLLHSFDFGQIVSLPLVQQRMLCLTWMVVAVAAVLVNAVMTARMARQLRIPLNARPAQLAAFALTPCVAVAAAMSYQFLFLAGPSHAEQIRYIAPVWMMLYGTGIYTAGLFSVRPPRLLGMAFIAAGMLAMLCFAEYGVIAVAASFGLFHIVFGGYVISKQRQAAVA